MERFEILMAYDDIHALKAVSDGFKAEGFRVTKASTEDEAIELVRSRRFDVVITSVVLDPEKRNAVLKEAKKFNRDTVIVLLGRSDDPKHDHDTLSVGDQDHVFSPSGMPILWRRVQASLERVDAYNRVIHSRELVRKFRNQISRISESISGGIREELERVAERIQRIRSGAFGKIDERAARELDELHDTVSWLVRETDMISRGFLPGKRPHP